MKPIYGVALLILEPVPLAILAVSGTTDSDAGLASGLINAFLVGRVRGDRHRPGAAVRPEQPPGRGREKRRRRGVAGVDRGVTAGRFLVLPRQWSTRVWRTQPSSVRLQS